MTTRGFKKASKSSPLLSMLMKMITDPARDYPGMPNRTEAAICEKCNLWDIADPIVRERLEYRKDWTILKANGGAFHAAKCRCENPQLKLMEDNTRLYNSNIPIDRSRPAQRFSNFICMENSQDPYDQKRVEVKAIMQEFATGERQANTLLMYGPVGGGKSHLSIACLWAALDQGKTVRYENARELLLDKLIPGWTGTDGESGRAVVQRCKNVDLLVLDDIGTEKASEHTQGSLYDIIDTRIRYGRPLICTTNIGSLSEGEQQFGSRIHSRLLAKDVLRVSLRVDDYRRKLEPVREEKAF
jgi:DNA replication protein DnaC